MEFLDQENVKDLYFINFYPSKNLDDFIQIPIEKNEKYIKQQKIMKKLINMLELILLLTNLVKKMEITYLFLKWETNNYVLFFLILLGQ